MTLAKRLGRETPSITKLWEQVITLRLRTDRLRIMTLLMKHGVLLSAELINEIENPADD